MKATRALLSLLLAATVFSAPAGSAATNEKTAEVVPAKKIEVRRFAVNPIIRSEMLPGNDGDDINGPSLVRVPAWITNRLGNYYLYFAHHQGKYIRLAYADKLHGPWKIHAPGVLALKEVPTCKGHIASPDVLVDEPQRELRMYFHGPTKSGNGQESFVSTSKDGLHFTAQEADLGRSYFRVFRWQDAWFAVAKGGELYHSTNGFASFEHGPWLLPGAPESDATENNERHARHVALHRVGTTLWIYYTNIGDAPEQIFRCHLQLTPDWRNWKTSPSEEVLRPETDYEGANLPITKSRSGETVTRENALRDPDVFSDSDGRVYLLYSVAGESGIAIAELTEKPDSANQKLDQQ